MILTQEHEAIRRSAKRLIESEINPHVDEWEEAGIFPAREVFRKFGQLGLLGVTKPTDYGGMGLDYSYGAVFCEALAHIKCGGVPMAVGVQADMAMPAMARMAANIRTEPKRV